MKKLQSQGTFNLLRQFCFFEVSTELQQFQQKEGKKLKKSHIIKSDVGLGFFSDSEGSELDPDWM